LRFKSELIDPGGVSRLVLSVFEEHILNLHGYCPHGKLVIFKSWDLAADKTEYMLLDMEIRGWNNDGLRQQLLSNCLFQSSNKNLDTNHVNLSK